MSHWLTNDKRTQTTKFVVRMTSHEIFKLARSRGILCIFNLLNFTAIISSFSFKRYLPLDNNETLPYRTIPFKFLILCHHTEKIQNIYKSESFNLNHK